MAQLALKEAHAPSTGDWAGWVQRTPPEEGSQLIKANPIETSIECHGLARKRNASWQLQQMEDGFVKRVLGAI